MGEVHSLTTPEIDARVSTRAPLNHTHSLGEVGIDASWTTWSPTFVGWGGGSAIEEVAKGTAVVTARYLETGTTKVNYRVQITWGSSTGSPVRNFGITLPHALVTVFQVGAGMLYRNNQPFRSGFVGGTTYNGDPVFGWIGDQGAWWACDVLNDGDILIASLTAEVS